MAARSRFDKSPPSIFRFHPKRAARTSHPGSGFGRNMRRLRSDAAGHVGRFQIGVEGFHRRGFFQAIQMRAEPRPTPLRTIVLVLICHIQFVLTPPELAVILMTINRIWAPWHSRCGFISQAAVPARWLTPTSALSGRNREFPRRGTCSVFGYTPALVPAAFVRSENS